MSSAVLVRNVRKAYDKHVAVEDVSLEVPQGIVFGLLGPNGAGKTTTIRMIMDIIRPDSGSVEIFGGTPNTVTLDGIGYLPEERGLYKRMKVLDVLGYLGSLKGIEAAEARRRAVTWLDKVGLAAWKERKIEELSKGMAQKVQFVSTLLHEPKLLILDEPFSGLDPVNANQLKDLFVEVNRAGATIIFSTHMMESAEKLCRQIALISKGRVVLEGSIGDVKRHYGRNNVLLEFDGDSGFLKALPGVKGVDDYGAYSEVMLKDGADPQELLAGVAPRVKLRRFEIVEPTLHNIFIQVAGPDAAEALKASEAASHAAVSGAGGAR
ncbi:MAG TPA: ATP-binding cassette domain-containing protein [Candidatus Eisenbacteria bacterium]